MISSFTSTIMITNTTIKTMINIILILTLVACTILGLEHLSLLAIFMIHPRSVLFMVTLANLHGSPGAQIIHKINIQSQLHLHIFPSQLHIHTNLSLNLIPTKAQRQSQISISKFSIYMKLKRPSLPIIITLRHTGLKLYLLIVRSTTLVALLHHSCPNTRLQAVKLDSSSNLNKLKRPLKSLALRQISQ